MPLRLTGPVQAGESYYVREIRYLERMISGDQYTGAHCGFHSDFALFGTGGMSGDGGDS